MDCFIGIDPGVGGGVACIEASGKVYFAVPMPESDRDLFRLVSGHDLARLPRAVLEKVRSSPQMGVTSAFTFGAQYGRCRMALAAAAVPFDEVAPAVWQRRMSCLTEGDKNVTKLRAQQLFPHQKVTHAIADALLIAEFCRRSDLKLKVPA